MNSKTRTVPYRRKREGKTDYRKRLKILLSNKPRLVVRKSLKEVYAQIIQYDEKGDKVVASFKGSDLKKQGWPYSNKNTASAYLVGLSIGKLAIAKKINDAILDLGLNKAVPGSKTYAVLRGAVDAGLKVPHSKEVLPDDNRIMGKHIEDFANSLEEEKLKLRFGKYLKDNANPKEFSKKFDEIKKKITGA